MLVPCEMLGVQADPGCFILGIRDRLAYEQLMAVILVLGVIGYLLDTFERSVIRRLAPES